MIRESGHFDLDDDLAPFIDAPAGTLIIQKNSSGAGHEPLEGVEFKVTYADGSFVPNEY